jgi:hypothetical protein
MKNFNFEENSLNDLSNEEKIKTLSNAVINTKVDAEMNKLDNEEHQLKSQNIFSKLIGKIDGSNTYKQENINFKRFVINDKLSRNSQSESTANIHSILADIELFMEDNNCNTLIEDELQQLNSINNCIYNNFDINSDEVNKYITDRKQIFLPVLTRKLTKAEIIKHESIKYLNKQGYNK